MTAPGRLHLFQAFGVELEYMIVDRDSLQVRPIADELLKAKLGEYGGDFENGMVTWSNELVTHVIELKSTKPEPDLPALSREFAENVKEINQVLESWNAMLLPTAAHPWMDPLTESRLWPHDNNEVYEAYNRIFDCRGHGWSNLQSTHLNLPFYDDEEFARLHAAIRAILPLLPALCASSPILGGQPTGLLDTRLHYYRTNQRAIPSITGKVIPEAVFSKRQYFNTIYERIKADIAPFDSDSILDPIWVNSRGAIPRFDRGSIEIRIMDVQECPSVDLAIQALVIETIRALAQEKFSTTQDQMQLWTENLAALLEEVGRGGPEVPINEPDYLAVFGLGTGATAGQVWEHIHQQLTKQTGKLDTWNSTILALLNKGPLARRILNALAGSSDPDPMTSVYRSLADCLATDRMFSGKI
ncbi:MAG: glutamate--cysteine ligase [Cyclobacteriaceae bacterium]|nr:glutamate--cysteine ligase [Cyclobacteriaceae bacterium]